MVHYDPNSPFRSDQQKYANRLDEMERNEQHFRTTKEVRRRSWRRTEVVYLLILGAVATGIVLWPLFALFRIILLDG